MIQQICVGSPACQVRPVKYLVLGYHRLPRLTNRRNREVKNRAERAAEVPEDNRGRVGRDAAGWIITRYAHPSDKEEARLVKRSGCTLRKLGYEVSWSKPE